MKQTWMILLIAVLCAGSVMAQGRNSRRGSRNASKENTNQVITIKEISGVSGKGDYEAVPPQVNEKFKLRVNHTDTYKRDSVNGWHYFEVAYQVAAAGTDDAGKKKPVLELPEVEITYALLYDMSKSKLASSVKNNAQKAGGAIGWDNPKQLYTLLTETFTYTSITPGREHYAAVVVPPSFVAVRGEPILFSVQISVDGVQQGLIATQMLGGAKVDGKDLSKILGTKDEPAAWWSEISSLTDTVVRQDGVLRDRSQSPFLMAGDAFYDQVKTK